MKKKSLLLLLLCLSTIWNGLLAQEATTTIFPKSFLIGDQALVTMQLKLKKGQSVVWPTFLDSTSTYKFDVIERGTIDTLKSDTSKWITYTQKLKVTTFDTGSIVVAPVTYYGQDSTLIAISDSMMIHVSTIDVDTNKAFMDISGIMSEPIRLSELLPWILSILGAAIVIALVVIYFIRRKKNKPLFTMMKTKTLSPHEYALQALKSLQEKRLWHDGHVKQYYIELTDILRIYITNQYHIDAMEMLSSEIVAWMATVDEAAPEQNKMRELFTIADLAKFAKASPLPNENDLYLNYAFAFVNATKPLEKEMQRNDKNENTTQNSETL